MSAGESSIENASPSLAAARRGAVGRVWQWFWRADAMRESVREVPPERVVLVQRARLAADAARRVEHSAEPFEISTDPITCELYRQSIRWSIAALTGATVSAAIEPPPWASLEPALIERALPDAVLLDRVERAVCQASFESLAALPAEDCAKLLVGLRSTALALIAELEVDQRARKALWAQRILRLSLIFWVFFLVALLVVKGIDSAEQGRDLARGAPWRISSVYTAAQGCRSPEQECPEGPDYFFHTLDEPAPWVEFDLNSAQQISEVRVDNRKDCCTERAAPLIVEVSSDHQKWQIVARRDSGFTSWLASFAPVRARWLRLRLDRRESFHLKRVRILR